MVPLSRREQEVAGLVAEGATNREIAERLFISERTVEGHVESIRNKLGFRSRAQIAAWVAERRPAGAAAGATAPAAAAGHGTAAPDGRAVPAPPRRRVPRSALAVGALAVVGAVVAAVVLLQRGSATPAAARITTVAAADLAAPLAVTVDAAGRLYVLDGNRVRRLQDGRLATVAGTGRPGSAGDGGPAAQAELDGPQDIAVDGTGDLFIADSQNNRVRRVDPRGVITTVAGTGERGDSGDGGPGVLARLDTPTGLAVGFGGTLLIADTGNNRVRALAGDGTITTVAGTGDAGYAGDGSPATTALLNAPRCLAVDARGTLYVADTLNDRIRQVDASGVISTLAGTGDVGASGDGGPARRAALHLASGPLSGAGCLAVDAAGDLLVADALDNRVRRVGVDGDITTVAGDGQAGSSGDGDVATRAQLSRPLGVAVDAAGCLVVADTDNNTLRRVC